MHRSGRPAVPDGGAVPRLLDDRYRLHEIVGIGSSAVVRRAWDEREQRWVAVKTFLHPDSRIDVHRRRKELAALAVLDHPGLVRLHDGTRAARDDEGERYLVMEFVEGPTLATRIAEGPVPAGEVLALARALAGALAHVHARGFVHRDIKPGNVLLGPGGPRLADFGIARGLDDTVVTRTGEVIGTPAYLAPEQVRGGPVGSQADVYALGLVLLEAVTGRREYDGAAVETAVARLHRPPRIPPDLPGGLGPLLRSMTITEPRRRLTADETVARLADPQPTVPQPRPRPRRGVLAVVAALVVAGVGVGAVALTPGGDPVSPATGSPVTSGAPAETSQPAAPPGPGAGETVESDPLLTVADAEDGERTGAPAPPAPQDPAPRPPAPQLPAPDAPASDDSAPVDSTGEDSEESPATTDAVVQGPGNGNGNGNAYGHANGNGGSGNNGRGNG